VDHLKVIDLAAQTGLTTDDAAHLWLARKTGEELVIHLGDGLQWGRLHNWHA
jgi:hypothetical protein